MVTDNRIEDIRADAGGDGPYGNAISVFRAGNVIVRGNRIDKCAFSAIRGNSASNIQIAGNICTRLGEVAIYSEFSFEGAVIANNTVDGATDRHLGDQFRCRRQARGGAGKSAAQSRPDGHGKGIGLSGSRPTASSPAM